MSDLIAKSDFFQATICRPFYLTLFRLQSCIIYTDYVPNNFSL